MKIKKGKTVLVLCVLSVVLIGISVFGQVYKYNLNEGRDRYLTTVFNLDEEHNIPTFFSTMMMLACSLLLILIGESKEERKGKYRWHWTGLGFIFFFLAFDEATVFHEKTIEPIRNFLNTGGLLHFAWVIPAGVFLLILLLCYWKFLVDLPARFRGLFVLSGSVYVAGAMGMEMLSGLFLSRQGEDNLGYALLTNFEETLEIIGLLLFIHALLSYVVYSGGRLSLKVK